MDTFSRYDGTRLSSQDSARACENTRYERKEVVAAGYKYSLGMSVSVTCNRNI